MSGELQVATVADTSPLAVRLKGATTDTLVQWAPIAQPVDLAVGERVAVAIIDRQVWFYGRADPA